MSMQMTLSMYSKCW